MSEIESIETREVLLALLVLGVSALRAQPGFELIMAKAIDIAGQLDGGAEGLLHRVRARLEAQVTVRDYTSRASEPEAKA